ncbi:hypothetical protein B0I31_101477 [Saccharothrix carnea]|uniref:Carbohydrate binding protein n=1 Tax=Saccharothrix carnea TaxID=1280637 RepID=A0A2P8III6_SACCR|nr:hypothetical protein [Saccharothrix carnea]PSL58261.1 hypothetical protein B0I31_101477 [Saccharothrix carnea]
MRLKTALVALLAAASALVSAGSAVAEPTTKDPVPVTGVWCDGDTYKCRAALGFRDGRWAADWGVEVLPT